MSFLGIRTKADRMREAIDFSSNIGTLLDRAASTFFHLREGGQIYEIDNYIIEKVSKLWPPVCMVYIDVWEPRLKLPISYPSNIDIFSAYPKEWYHKEGDAVKRIVLPPADIRKGILNDLQRTILDHRHNELLELIEKKRKQAAKVKHKIEEAIGNRFEILDL